MPSSPPSGYAFLHALHQVSLRGDEPLPERLQAYLRVGCRLLRVSAGAVLYVEGDELRVEASVGAHGWALGARFPVHETSLREVVFGLMPDAQQDLCPGPLGLGAFIAAPIELGDEVAVLLLGQPAARERAWSIYEHEFVGLMAQNIGQLLERERHVRALLASERHFRAAFTFAASGMALVSPEGDLLQVNQRLADMVGHGARTHLRDLVHSADLARLEAAIHALWVEGEGPSLRVRLRHREGRALWGQVSLGLVCHAGGAAQYYILEVQDVTARLETERRLVESERRFRLLAEMSSDMVSCHTPEGETTYISPACDRLLGYDPEELLGRSLMDLCHPEDRARLAAHHGAVLDPERHRSVQYRLKTRRGDWAWFETTSAMVRTSPEAAPVLQCTSRDITDRKAVEEQLRLLSETDPLTGLANRRVLMARMAEAFDERGVVSMLLLDVDHFKSYNDTYGHPAGDEVLACLSGILQGTCREADLAARYGGEEFAVLLPGTSLEGAERTAERLRVAIAEAQWGHRQITVSIGVAQSGVCFDSGALVEHADEALYAAKEGGRNRVRCYAPELPVEEGVRRSA